MFWITLQLLTNSECLQLLLIVKIKSKPENNTIAVI